VGATAELEQQLESVELLGEPVRRALYLHVARQPHELGEQILGKAATLGHGVRDGAIVGHAFLRRGIT